MSQSLPDIDTAAATIFDRVHADAFFAKLAEYGHVPQSRDEAKSLLELSAKLASTEAKLQTKQASAGCYAQATSALDQLLDNAPANREHVKKAAAERKALALLHDSDIYLSAASLKLAEVQAAGTAN